MFEAAIFDQETALLPINGVHLNLAAVRMQLEAKAADLHVAGENFQDCPDDAGLRVVMESERGRDFGPHRAVLRRRFNGQAPASEYQGQRVLPLEIEIVDEVNMGICRLTQEFLEFLDGGGEAYVLPWLRMRRLSALRIAVGDRGTTGSRGLPRRQQRRLRCPGEPSILV